MKPSEDLALKALLEQHWQAPAASPMAVARLLEAAKAAPRQSPRVFLRWALPGAAVAAALLLGLWVAVPGVRTPLAPGTALSASLTDEDMMSYVFATYQLEETS
jgi:hypothetical protein